MKFTRLLCVLVALPVWSCAEDASPVSVDAEWNLSCPDPETFVDCGQPAPETCLGPGGARAIAGGRGETSCDGEGVLVVDCDAVERSDDKTSIALEAAVGGFALELDAVLNDGSLDGFCNVTIVEDGIVYGLGACGTDPPSIEQPCQLSNVTARSGEVAFGLECAPIISPDVGEGFHVSAPGGGPTTIRFSNCDGL